jgi:H+/gluconate symporter-like permease
LGDDFVAGFFLGCLASAVGGWFFAKMRWLIKQAGEAGRKQKTQSETTKTPLEVTVSSFFARLWLLLISVACLLGLLALGRALLGG